MVAPYRQRQPHEHVLHHVLGLGAGAGQPECDAEEATGVSLIDPREGTLVTAPQALDEHAVIPGRIVAAWHDVDRCLAHSRRETRGAVKTLQAWTSQASLQARMAPATT